MQKVAVLGADGSRAVLAYVRENAETVFVCAPSRIREVRNGDERPVVGFPKKDVVPVD